MTIHTLEPERRTLHGKFSRELPPVLTIDPGDSVIYRTLDAGWGLEPVRADGSPRAKFEPRDPERDSGHALCGPIAIRGAQPGLTLAVTIDAIRPGTWGATYAGGWPHPVHQRLGLTEKELVMIWSLDAERLAGRNQFGHTLALRPFMGVMGLPPDEPGWHDTAPPRATGGNLDCKELVAGSTLYLPIAAPGGLFSVGDGHAVQGDGEVCVTAIECPMERVALTFHLRDDVRLTAPRANTPVGWITFGLHEDLNEATYRALEGMLDLLGELHGLPRLEALALASLAVDFRITQIVNGVRGVHAVLPHEALKIPEESLAPRRQAAQ
jgi:acetamidase/formamidase